MMQRNDNAAPVIRRALAGDCEGLGRISVQAFSQPMSSAEFERELSVRFSLILIAEVNGALAGFINIWRVCGEADLNNIAVDTAYRRRGIGQALLDAGIRECSDCSVMTLEVRRSNSAAIAFYEKNGFEFIGVRKDFYEKPQEDAAIYKKALKGQE